MSQRLISVLLILLFGVTQVVISTSVRELLSGFTGFFYSLNYEKKQEIVNEAVQELQAVFPDGMQTISIPEIVDVEVCKSTLEKAVKQNHEWYILSMGQFAQLKFYNHFLNDKVAVDLQERINSAAESVMGSGVNKDSIIVDGMVFTVGQLSQILADSNALKEENAQLRNAISGLQEDLERSSSTIEELKLEVQSVMQESNRAKIDFAKIEKKYSTCRRSEYNLKKIVYELKRSKFSKFKSFLARPFTSRKLKKTLGKEGYQKLLQRKKAEKKKRKVLVKNLSKEMKKQKKEKKKKLLDKMIIPGEETPLSSSRVSESSFSSQDRSASQSKESSTQDSDDTGSGIIAQSSFDAHSPYSKGSSNEQSLGSIFESSG